MISQDRSSISSRTDCIPQIVAGCSDLVQAPGKKRNITKCIKCLHFCSSVKMLLAGLMGSDSVGAGTSFSDLRSILRF